MNLYPLLALFSLVFGLVLGIGITKKYKKNRDAKKIGCLGAYITLISIAISVIAIPLAYVIPATFAPLFSGERMQVPIVDQSWHYDTSEDSDGRKRTVKMYTPIVEITLENGRAMQREMDYSSGDQANIGAVKTIYYDEENDEILSVGIVSILVKILGFTLCLLMLAILWYGVNYTFGRSRERPLAFIMALAFKGLIPMMMIGFTLGMLGYLYNTWILGNNPENHSLGIAFMAAFFALTMLFVLWVYFGGLMGKNGKDNLKTRIEKRAIKFTDR